MTDGGPRPSVAPAAGPEGRARIDSPLVDLAVLLGLLALAALLRLPDLATRGTWDADQGHDMLVLRSLVRDGVIPLLGPPTSIGDFHHGALYYYLLSPAAFLTGGDSPLAVTAEIALAGIAAVAVTWWLGRSMAGRVGGLVAGLLLAVSASAVEESTFIWNPNLIALSSAIALAGAWRAWTTGRARWWLVAAVGTAVTMQCHVLGVTLLPIVGALLVADARRRGPGSARRSVLLTGLTGVAIIAVTYVPLVVHEATSGFAEARAAIAWVQAGAGPTDLPIPLRLLVVLTRVVTWPLTGLITAAPIASLAGLALVLAIIGWRWSSPDDRERVAVRWLGLGLLWSAGFLTFAASGLATVVPGLPNDHYHAFADPMVVTLVGIGAAAAVRAWRDRSGAVAGAPRRAEAPSAPRASPLAMILAGGVVVVVIGLVGWNLVHQPPAVAFDGGFPAADAAARRIESEAGSPVVALRSLPTFKPADTYGYPLVRNGVALASEAASPILVIVCDDLFHEAIGAPCGGPAEAASLATSPWPTSGPAAAGAPFEAAPGRWVMVDAAR